MRMTLPKEDDVPLTAQQLISAMRSWGRIGAHVSWANTTNRTARTAPARAALEAKFLREAGGDPVRAQHLRKAYYLRLAQRSAAVRRKRKEQQS